MQYLIKFIATP